MDEDIKRIEAFKNRFEIVKMCCVGLTKEELEEIEDKDYSKKVKQSIENLIARYKELEKQMGKDLDVVYIKGVYDERDKWKSKVKEKIEWLEEISDNGINAVRFAGAYEDEIKRIERQKNISTMIGILQELLEE